MYRELYNDIDCIAADCAVDLVVVEVPTPLNMRSAMVQYGMLAIVEKFAADSDIGYLSSIGNPKLYTGPIAGHGHRHRLWV